MPHHMRRRLPGWRWVLAICALAVLALVLVTLARFPASDEPSPSLSVWAVDSLERVGQHDPAPARAEQPAIYAARGETEALQVVIRASKRGITNVRFAVSDLRGPPGAIIPRAQIALYREHYVYVRQPSPDRGGPNRPLGAGWYPDALIPFVDPATQRPPAGGVFRAIPFDLAAGANQPIWLDVSVPRDARAGEYLGTYSVSSDQIQTSGTFRLTVWNFTLPLKPSLKSSFLFLGLKTRAANIELLRHKLMPDNVAPRDQPGLSEQYGLRIVNMNFWSGADGHVCALKPAPDIGALHAAAADTYPGLQPYNYTADEIDQCPDVYEPLKQWARNLHAAGIANLVTMTPVPALFDDGSGTGRSAVDIWVLLPKMYDAARSQVAAAQAKGDEVWSYNALVQDDYSPKWEIDFAPINYRIQPGFISQSLGLTGLLYWRVDLWTADPWADVQTYANDGQQYPGEGMLVYPGAQVGIDGVVPSMRLKWLRDGVEDYEYVELLKQRGEGAWALALSHSVGASWSDWTLDPAKLAAVRMQLGARLDASRAP